MVLDVFWRFLLLGFTSFGGPAAHLGYFRKEFVERLRWCDESQYSQWVALSQIMPGPGSSQVGFAIGVYRAGILGGIAAFVGFTSPSVVMMIAIASLESSFATLPYISSLIDALKLLAIVVVLDAIFGMARGFLASVNTWLIAVCAFVFILLWPYGYSGLIVVLFAGIAGTFLTVIPAVSVFHSTVGKRLALASLALFVLLFSFAFAVTGSGSLISYLANLYQAGALVFGGGHVVLPLITESLSGIQSTEDILVGYAAAQAVPGPMFTIASYLGSTAAPLGDAVLWGALSTLAIFLPGLLLMLVGSHYWAHWSHLKVLQKSIIAINASVVGLLFATLINPIVLTSVSNIYDAIVVAVVFILSRRLKLPIWQLILLFTVWAAVRMTLPI
ncbi:chromate efflux transporter [Marinomonas mediterranea]|jgi:chromate transporter, chromate ion transporter (CHR) family|uniref:Chromate transporter, chromate ion transporter (CHR) family n=1 Tax=Marinomonas mediterranea (strain ATCC 700492 / JCM 21426 / NBRC 103028 / MMB-1) TaxID=717774 RepID=F2K137_MARM1|nr:chromate efflux transporter [Marinomonas mediterranea]ADZ89887.1 chromate transporter, chromate ion transporter (CHR) family [Marinomonas mediterranea MMB-1]